MSSLKDKVHEAELEVKIIELEAARVREAVRKARKDVEALEKRQKELYGGWHSHGLIDQAKTKLKQACRDLIDSGARKVVWATPPSWSCRQEDKTYVVVKVTPKRVYIREAGTDREKYHDKLAGNGNSKYDGKIDIEKTFPEGLDNFIP